MKAKQQLGQNFLMHGATARRIAGSPNLPRGSRVLEIGPGTGMLTRALLDAGLIVTAIETDKELIPQLEETFSLEIQNGSLTLIHGDIRTFDLQNLSRPQRSLLKNAQMQGASERDSESYKSYGEELSDGRNTADGRFSPDSYHVIANIPYYITGEILRLLLTARNKPSSMTLLVQKEVAVRIARAEKESLLSLSVKAYGVPSITFLVPRGAFRPAPNVDSAVLHVSGITSSFESEKDETLFFSILHAGFGQKRKRLAKNLEGLYEREEVERVFGILNLSLNTRAEDVSLSTWLSLTSNLHRS